MLHTPSYTALNRCAQEGERWSGGYTNQPHRVPSPPLPSSPLQSTKVGPERETLGLPLGLLCAVGGSVRTVRCPETPHEATLAPQHSRVT